MSKRRVGSASPRPDGPPVVLVEVDLDAPPEVLAPSSPAGTRVWVEVGRSGRIVGVLEARAGEPLAPAALTALGEADAAAGRQPVDVVADADLSTATVVVPTICRNPDQLIRTVRALLAMDHPDFDVVVVDNRTDPSAPALPSLLRDGRVTTVVERRKGISAARNAGIAAARGQVVCFTDDDAVADPRWLRAICARFAKDHDVQGVGGLVLPLEFETEPQLWFEEFYGGFSRSFGVEIVSAARPDPSDALFPYAPGRYGAGCNMGFRREVLERVGGFDETLGVGTPAKGGEDLAMFLGLVLRGGTVAFEPAAVVRHAHRRTEEEFLRQVRNYGTGLTAMYTDLVVHEPRQLLEMARRVPDALRLLARPRAARSVSSSPSYPPSTLAHQVLGMAYGPVAFARSALRARRSR